MGGGQSNSGQASQASANANASSQQNLATSSTDQARNTQLVNSMFGTGAPGSTGSLSGFLNPNSMNVTTPTGAYKLNYQQTVNQTENEAQQGQSNIIRQAANNGLGLSSPAVAQQAMQTNLATANMKGQDFANAVTQQHSDAMNNFWGATNAEATAAGQAGTNAVSSASGAGQTAANVYGTAGQYHPNPATSIIGAGLQAGGAVGAAAANPACPAEGQRIKTPEGDRLVEELKRGDEISQLGNIAKLKCDPIRHENVPLIRVESVEGLSVLVGEKHAFVSPDWGYFNADELLKRGRRLLKTEGLRPDRTAWAARAGIGTVYEIVTVDGEGNRTYCVGDCWSLE
jgi:hypothetical protein